MCFLSQISALFLKKYFGVISIYKVRMMVNHEVSLYINENWQLAEKKVFKKSHEQYRLYWAIFIGPIITLSS